MKFTSATIIASLAVAVAAVPADVTYPVCIKEHQACQWYADSYFSYGDHPENQCCTGYSCSGTEASPVGTCTANDDSAEPTYPAQGETCHRRHRRDWQGDCGPRMRCDINWTAYPDGKTGTCENWPSSWPSSGTDYESYANTDYDSADYEDTYGNQGEGQSCSVTWNSGPDGDCSSGYTCKCLGDNNSGTCVARPDCSGDNNDDDSNTVYPADYSTGTDSGNGSDYPMNNDNGDNSGEDYPVYDHNMDNGDNSGEDYPVYDHNMDNGDNSGDYPSNYDNGNDSGDNTCSASGASCSCDSECCSGHCTGLGMRSGGSTLGATTGCCSA